MSIASSAIHAPNQFVEIDGRRLAYRDIGSATGTPIVLCTRFRGNMDVWDPLFLDTLGAQGLRVITFDYSGLGLSTGVPDYDPAALAKDASDLMKALKLGRSVIAGWSLGGIAAQVFLALFPEQVSHVVVIGSVPPGPNVKPAEQLFFDTANIPDYTLEDQTILFFEPKSAASREAARRSVDRIASRTAGRSVPVPHGWAREYLGTSPKSPLFPSDAVLQVMKTTAVPILHVGGDHDIIFPVENWYALNQVLPTVRLLTFPSSGHGPQHQHPVAAGEGIASFIRSAK